MDTAFPPPFPSVSRKVWLFSCSLLLISILVSFVCFRPQMPQNDLDPSWAWGISYAVDNGWRLGTDLIFTYGPLANAYTWLYSEQHGLTYLAVSAYLAACLFFGSWSLFVDQRRAIPVLLLAFLTAWLGMYKDGFFMLIPVLAVFNIIGAHLPEESLRGRRFAVVCLLLPAFGVLALIKLSFAVICAVGGLVSVILLARRREYKSAALIVVLPLVSLAALWVLMGQKLVDLPNYVLNALPIISGYTEAMSIYGGLALPGVMLAGSLVLLHGMVTHKRISRPLAWCAATTGAAYLFLAFKAGFVRQDAHGVASGSAVALLTVVAWPFMQSVRALAIVAVSVVAGLIVSLGSLATDPVSLTRSFTSRVANSFDAAATRLLDSAKFRSDYDAAVQKIAAADPLPKLEGPSDIYSYDQAVLLASGNEWSPRPILQSYSAYTPGLMNVNADHLNGDKAPENIFFGIQPIDGHLASLEDGASWPYMFAQYDPVSISAKRVVLKRNDNPMPKMIELGRETSRMGSAMAVPKFDGQVYMTVVVKPSLWGKLRSFLFKPSYLLGRVTFSSGEPREYRVVSGMMQTPFLISPIVDSPKEFVSLYSGPELLEGKKAESFTVFNPKGSDRGWLDSVEVAFYGLKIPSNDKVKGILGISEIKPAVAESTGQCIGSLDAINGSSVVDGKATVKNYLSLRGWSAVSVETPMDNVKRVAILENGQGTWSVDAVSEARPDVAAYFKSSNLRMSGYSVLAETRKLKGSYQLTMGMVLNGSVIKCPQPPVSVSFE